MISRRVLVVSFGLLAVVSTASATDLTGPLTFVGITPCRVLDTRATSGFTGQAGPPALVAEASRTFQITGTVPGVPTQCGIPDTAVAISVNLTVTGFTSVGHIRVYPAGGTLPLVSILNFQLQDIANATTMPLGPSGSGHNGIAVFAHGSSTHFIADVNGYYVPLASPGVCGTNDVSIGGHCYYLDGSAGKCDPGYAVVPQSVLSTIAASFAGKTYKHAVSDNCCIFNADPVENWGMGAHCTTAGTFSAGDPSLGAFGCTGATVFNPAQLTLCGK